MKLLMLGVLLQAGLVAQSISVMSPSAGQTISGTAHTLTVTITGIPNIYSVEYDVNGETACVIYAAPWSCIWNTSYVYNNPYNSVAATVRDVLNNTLATSNSVSFTVDNPNWPVAISVCNMTVSTATPPTSIWSGTNLTYTLTPTGSNCASNSTAVYIDGEPVSANHIDTTKFDNGTHTVVFTLYDLNAPRANLNISGQWERQINFQNGAAPMELRSDVRDMWLCTTTQTNCPASGAFHPLVYNTDGTSRAASGLTYSSGNAAVATVNSSGVVTAVGVGSMQVTITDRSGRVAMPWVHVNTQNLIASFGTDGTFHTSFVAGKSLWISDSFFSQSGFGEHDFPAHANFGQAYSSIFNTYEVGIWCQPLTTTCGGSNQGAWQAAQTSYVARVQREATSYGLYAIGIGDSAVRQTGDLFTTTRSAPGTTWSPSAPEYTARSWMGTRLIGMRMFDEGNTIWGEWPLAGQLTLGSTLMPGPITCTTRTCTVTGNSGALSNGGGGGFIIRGATTHAGLNSTPAEITATVSGGAVTGYTITNPGSGYTVRSTLAVGFSGGCSSFPSAAATISATGTISAINGTGGSGCRSAPKVFITGSDGTGPPFYFVGRNPTNTSFTFVNPGLGATTVSSSTDPGLVIEPFATIAGWFDAQGNNGPRTGPATDYVRYNAFSQFVGQWRAAGAKYPLLSWGVAGGYDHTSIANWIGDPKISDYATLYIQPGQDYLSQYNGTWGFLGPASGSVTSLGWTFRDKYSVLGANRINYPIMGESSGINVDYGLEGYPVDVASCVGNLITFSAAHKIYNILPANTRLWITGSTDSNCNQNFYVMDCPNATQCHVALSQASFNADIAPIGATANLSSGATVPVSELSSSNQKFPSFTNTNDNASCSLYQMANHRGETVRFSGGNTGAFGGATWWYVPAPLSGGCGGGNGTTGAIYPLPSTSGTGGTATIVQNESYTRGVNHVGSNSEGGPRSLFAGNIYYALLPSAGTTAYGYQGYYDDPRSHDHPAAFRETGNLSIQAGFNPYFLQYSNHLAWVALGNANKLMQRLAPLLFGQNQNAPDLGQFFDCGARTAAAGNYVACQSFSDGPSLTRTIPLSNCAVSGQAIEKITASWRGIWVTLLPSGTTSDTVTFTPDTTAFVAYACWRNTAENYTPPVISASLADIPNAAKIVVQYNYLPDPFQQPLINRSMLFQSFDCGSGTCTLPVDRNIGPIYYRVVYLNSSGAVLSQSDVQIL